MSDHSYMKNLKNKVITKSLLGHSAKEFHVCVGKEVEDNNRSIWLFSANGEEPDYSLWFVQPDENGENIYVWSYEGTDYNDLLKELMELFIETAFDK